MDLTYASISAFAVGFLGSLHCVGMCGGISGALGTALKTESSQRPWRETSRRLAYQFMYSSGRLFSYSIAGALAGTLGTAVTAYVPHGPLYLRMLAGLMMILLGFYISGWWLGLTKLEQLGNQLWQKIAPFTRKLIPVDTYPKALLLGVLWGWLPCGLVYSALTWSIGAGNPVDGALLMLYFGIGTLPAMIAVGLFANILADIAKSNAVRALAGIAMMTYGIWTIAGPQLPLH